MSESLCYFCQSAVSNCSCRAYGGDIANVLADYGWPEPGDETRMNYPCYRVQIEKFVSCDINEAEYYRFISMKTPEQQRRLIPVGCYSPPLMAHEVRFLRRKWTDDPTAQVFLTVGAAEEHIQWLKNSWYRNDPESLHNDGIEVSFRISRGFIRPGSEIAAILEYMRRPAADISLLQSAEKGVCDA